MTKNEILNYLSSHKEEFRSKFGVLKIGLFGSYARNDATQKSDIDLIIDMKPKSLTKRILLKQQLEKELNSSIDIGYLSSLRNFIAQEIKKDVIYV